MRSEIILLGNPSSGKSTMVNTLAVDIRAETCADQSPEKTREYEIDDMDIIDTCGLDLLLQNDDSVKKEFNNFLNDDDNNNKIKIIMYLIDSTHILKNDLQNIEYIQECISNKNGKCFDFIVVFNKCDDTGTRINRYFKRIKNILPNDSVLKVSCYHSFIERARKLNKTINLDVPNYDKRELKQMIRGAGYMYAGELKQQIKNKLFDPKYLKLADIDDECDCDDDECTCKEGLTYDNIYLELDKCKEQAYAKKIYVQFEQLDNYLMGCDNENIIKTCGELVNLINACGQNIEECNGKLKNKIHDFIQSKVDKSVEPIELDILNELTNVSEIRTVVYDLLIKNKEKFKFRTLFKNFVNGVHSNELSNDNVNDIFKLLVQKDELYEQKNYSVLIGETNMPKSIKLFMSYMSFSIKNLRILDTFGKINGNILNKYLGDRTHIKFRYLLQTADIDKFDNIYKTINEKSEELEMFMNDFDTLDKFQKTEQMLIDHESDSDLTYDQNDELDDSDYDSDSANKENFDLSNI